MSSQPPKVPELVLVIAALQLLLTSIPSRGQFVTAVPNSQFLIAGNTNSFYPFWVFWPYTGRYQQIYAAAQFSQPSNGGQYYQKYFAAMTNGGWISDIFFRFQGGSPVFNTVVSNVEIHLSTSPRAPDGLSPVFSDNVGQDDTKVFSGSLLLINSSRSNPEPYETHVLLDTNFWYNPTRGNLLLDVRVHQGVNFLPAPLDAVDVAGDSVSSVSSTNDTSGVVSTTGLVTFFEMAPPPLLVTFLSNAPPSSLYIVLNWINQPLGFVLQESSSLSNNAVWMNLLGTDTNVDFKHFAYPVNSNPAEVFRLGRP